VKSLTSPSHRGTGAYRRSQILDIFAFLFCVHILGKVICRTLVIGLFLKLKSVSSHSYVLSASLR
jgi:hypothetical protein